MPATFPLGILELIVLLSDHGLPQRAILRNTRVSQGCSSKVLHWVWGTGRAIHWAHGHELMMIIPREGRTFIWKIRKSRFFSSSRVRVELIRRTGRHVSARAVQWCLVAAGYHPRRPARCPVLIHDHCRWRRVCARKHRTWNHRHWFHVIFADEPRFSLYHCNGRARVRPRVGERPVGWCI